MTAIKSADKTEAPDLLKLWITVNHEAIQSYVDRIVGQLREGVTKVDVQSVKLALHENGKLFISRGWTRSNSKRMFERGGSTWSDWSI